MHATQLSLIACSRTVYLADAAGAAALFSASYPTHVARMTEWVQLAMLPPNAPQRIRPLPSSVGWLVNGSLAGDPLQTEYSPKPLTRPGIAALKSTAFPNKKFLLLPCCCPEGHLLRLRGLLP